MRSSAGDFLSVQDYRLRLNLNAVRKLGRRIPVVYHLNNDPAVESSGGCHFIKKLSTKGRRLLIQRRAAQQAKYRFRVSYPVLFPECKRKRPGQGTGSFLYSYNAFRDPPMGRTIARLLDIYD